MSHRGRETRIAVVVDDVVVCCCCLTSERKEKCSSMTGLQLHFLDGGVLKRCNYVAGLNLAEPGTRHLIIGVTGEEKV